jgi:DNA-binding LytR/AlgR family response regulator
MVEIVLYNQRTRPMMSESGGTAAETSPYLVTDAVFIKADNSFERVDYTDIYYVEANGNMVTIFTKNRKFIIRKSMKDMEEKLPSNLFLRVQKSFIVQLAQIDNFNTKEITLKTNDVVPVGRQYYNSFLAKLNTITES